MITTTAIFGNTKKEITLPRTIYVGEAPFGKCETIEANEVNANADFDYMMKEYGNDCHVFQKDENGNVLCENNADRIENYHRDLEAMGF